MNDLMPVEQVAQVEVWWPIAHLGEYVAERYEVSTLGRVRYSKDRGTRRGQILKPYLQSERYAVSLCVGPSRSRTSKIHLLVLNRFVGPRPAGLDGCHNDGKPPNNALDNLRWDTHSSNMLDRIRHGTCPLTNKVRCPWKHLLKTPNLVRANFDKGGRRRCLSCVGTHGANTYRRRKGKPTLDFQTESDRRYELIMAGEVVR